MNPQVDTQEQSKSDNRPRPSTPGRWQAAGAYVIKFAGSIEDAALEIEMAPGNVLRTFDALFHKHLSRLRSIKRQAQQTVSARLRYLHRQALATVRSMFMADQERLRWPGSDAIELVQAVSISTILARAKTYAEAVCPEPVWRKTSNVLC